MCGISGAIVVLRQATWSLLLGLAGLSSYGWHGPVALGGVEAATPTNSTTLNSTATSPGTPTARERFEFREPHMGTQFRLVLYLPDQASANRASQAAFRRIRELDARLSDYASDSELNQLCRKFPPGTEVVVSQDLYRMLRFSQQVAENSHGAFDVTVGPLSRIWRRARRRGELPDPQAVQVVLPSVGYRHLKLLEHPPRVQLAQPQMQIDLGGVAKGGAAHEAQQLLARRGAPSALVDGGGGVALGDPPPQRSHWHIAVPEPLQKLVGGATLALQRCSIATSGDTEQFLEVDGVRYSHLLDPRTGQALRNRRMATVVSPDGMTADALASVLCVIEPEHMPAVLARFPGTEAAVVELAAGSQPPNWTGYCTRGMSGLVATDGAADTGGSSTLNDIN